MTYGPLNEVLRHIRRIALTAEAAELDDGRLVERFLAHQDEAAFEALLHRHGPMVLNVCRRLLRDPHDTEDAFQATFLVLLRKAASLSRRELVANWLYGVAYRTALKARREAARRGARTKPLEDVSGKDSDEVSIWKDLRPVLDEELQRLPAKYRMPVILCYLEGKTFEEAARQLGWPAGTVSGRLARAKQLLRTRLTRRGVGLAGGLLGTALSQSASGGLPGQLMAATVRVGLALTTRHAATDVALPTSVVTLMEGVLHAMFMTKVKVVASLLLVVAIIGGGAGVVTYQKLAAQSSNQHEGSTSKAGAPAQQETDEEKAERLAEQASAVVTPDYKLKKILEAANVDQKMKSLLGDRVDAAKREVKARWQEYCAGRGTLDILVGSSRRLLAAELDLSTNKADRVGAWETHWQRMRDASVINSARYASGRIAVQDFLQTEYYRLDAEIGLERAKAQPKQNNQLSE
jgi:RNA polymerase sigma factor (sigma-70 family)